MSNLPEAPKTKELRIGLDNASKSLLALSHEVEERIEELEAKEKHWAEVVESIEKGCEAAKTKVVLDMGGTRFAISKSSLLRFPQTYFTGLLGAGKWKPEEDGSYFIDRNPKGFDIVLDYLRLGELDLSNVNDADLRARVKGHLNYFLIPLPETNAPPMEETDDNLRWNALTCPTGIRIEGKKITKNSNADELAWEAVRGDFLPTSGAFSLRILSRPEQGIAVGLESQEWEVNQFSLVTQTGTVGAEGIDRHSYCEPFHQGDIVTVVHDAKKSEIRFKRNGTDLGVAFVIKSSKMVPYVELLRAGACVEFI